MKLQKDMEESFLMTHRDFMNNLERSFEIIDHDLQEAAEVDSVCSGEWCQAIETSLDELAKFVYDPDCLLCALAIIFSRFTGNPA